MRYDLNRNPRMITHCVYALDCLSHSQLLRHRSDSFVFGCNHSKLDCDRLSAVSGHSHETKWSNQDFWIGRKTRKEVTRFSRYRDRDRDRHCCCCLIDSHGQGLEQPIFVLAKSSNRKRHGFLRFFTQPRICMRSPVLLKGSAQGAGQESPKGLIFL